MNKKKVKLPKRAWLSILVIFLAIPAMVLLSDFIGGRFYYFASVVLICLTFVPFFLVFETRRPQAREIVVLAVLCALAVASRVAFTAIPHFKPMLAIIMIAGIAFGPESGFLVGIVAGFASNFIFGQGPWTPWQMFAYGVGGYLAGGLFRLGLLSRKPLPMSVFGFLTIVLIVGPILDTSSVFTMITKHTAASVGAVYLSGLPLNIIHGIATFFTLLVFGNPLLDKLDRLKLKYGMMEDEDHAL